MSDTTLTLSPTLHSYLIDHSVREPEVLTALRSVTHKLSDSKMQISPEQGQFMQMLVRMLNAKKTLDIGTFTGYSSLAVALALPHDGQVITFDINEDWTATAKKYWQQADVANKITLKLGTATHSLQTLLDLGGANTFDFAFIDADKSNYDHYYELCLQLVRKGGLIAIDNVLWDGKVADPAIHDQSTQAIRELNQKIYHDDRVAI